MIHFFCIRKDGETGEYAMTDNVDIFLERAGIPERERLIERLPTLKLGDKMSIDNGKVVIVATTSLTLLEVTW